MRITAAGFAVEGPYADRDVTSSIRAKSRSRDGAIIRASRAPRFAELSGSERRTLRANVVGELRPGGARLGADLSAGLTTFCDGPRFCRSGSQAEPSRTSGFRQMRIE